MTAAKYDIFLSHNRRQKPWVRHIVALLREKGLTVFFDEDSIDPGENLIASLERAIEASKTLVLVLSRSSVFSKWVAFETTLRLYDDPESSVRRLIPVLVEPVDRTLIRPAIRGLDAVDLTDPSTREIEFRHFLRSVGISEIHQLPPWPEPSGIEELHVADLEDVTRWGWTGVELLEKLITLDYEILEELTPQQEGKATQWSPVFLDHPDTWRLLITPANEIVGYWHFVPLFDTDFECAIRGELHDSQITTNRVRLFELPGRYPIYFITFGLLPRFRRTKGYKLLLDSLFDVVCSLAKDGIFISEVCANAFSESGEALCKSFGMEFLRNHADRGAIYRSTLTSILNCDICRGYTDVVALYRAKFGAPNDEKQVRAAIL